MILSDFVSLSPAFNPLACVFEGAVVRPVFARYDPTGGGGYDIKALTEPEL